MKKNILLVNDDGIEALGIHKLAEALSDAGDVYVCSPHEQRSGSGHGISVGRTIYVSDARFKEAKHAILMEGTPVDCVKIGLEIYRGRGVEIDMVFSGFNHGPNLGTDTLYSGTVSAAVEGAMCGLPSAAMSIKASYHRAPANFETAMKLAKKIALSKQFSSRKSEDRNKLDVNFINRDHVILNVNFPDLPPEEIKGVKICPLSYQAYFEWFQEGVQDGRACYHYAGAPYVLGEAEADDSDVVANELGYVTITPLQFDLTDQSKVQALRRENFWE